MEERKNWPFGETVAANGEFLTEGQVRGYFSPRAREAVPGQEQSRIWGPPLRFSLPEFSARGWTPRFHCQRLDRPPGSRPCCALPNPALRPPAPPRPARPLAAPPRATTWFPRASVADAPGWCLRDLPRSAPPEHCGPQTGNAGPPRTCLSADGPAHVPG